MQAVLNDRVMAEADKADLLYIEGNWYFPPTSLNQEHFQKSLTPYNCPWKGDCQYWNVDDAKDAAWSYPDIMPSAIARVGKDFSGFMAFDKAKTQITE
jgi:uncharacterized protein (DUF427 family)